MNNVLRLTKDSKEELEFFDGSGEVYQVALEEISKKQALFKLEKQEKSQRELEYKVKYYLPVIKPEAFYWMLKKVVELGVSEIQPVCFSRSQKKYFESLRKQETKMQIAIQEAVEQCGGAVLPKLNQLQAFEELNFSLNLDATKLFAYEELSLSDQNENSIRKKAQDLPQTTDTELMVGPEGGLTTDETDKLRGCGFDAVSLGVRLLKAETAAVTLFAGYGK